jgi:hypothetical protein
MRQPMAHKETQDTCNDINTKCDMFDSVTAQGQRDSVTILHNKKKFDMNCAINDIIWHE